MTEKITLQGLSNLTGIMALCASQQKTTLSGAHRF